jgi:hypothetical protein
LSRLGRFLHHDDPAYASIESDSVRAVSALLAIALLIATLLARILQADGAEEWSILLLGFFGFGTAPLHVLGKLRGSQFVAVGIGVGIAIVLLLGFAFVEAGSWAAATAVFVVVAVASLGLHLFGLSRFWHARGHGARPWAWHMDIGTTGRRIVVALVVIGIALCLGSELADTD